MAQQSNGHKHEQQHHHHGQGEIIMGGTNETQKIDHHGQGEKHNDHSHQQQHHHHGQGELIMGGINETHENHHHGQGEKFNGHRHEQQHHLHGQGEIVMGGTNETQEIMRLTRALQALDLGPGNQFQCVLITIAHLMRLDKVDIRTKFLILAPQSETHGPSVEDVDLGLLCMKMSIDSGIQHRMTRREYGDVRQYLPGSMSQSMATSARISGPLPRVEAICRSFAEHNRHTKIGVIYRNKGASNGHVVVFEYVLWPDNDVTLPARGPQGTVRPGAGSWRFVDYQADPRGRDCRSQMLGLEWAIPFLAPINPTDRTAHIGRRALPADVEHAERVKKNKRINEGRMNRS